MPFVLCGCAACFLVRVPPRGQVRGFASANPLTTQSSPERASVPDALDCREPNDKTVRLAPHSVRLDGISSPRSTIKTILIGIAIKVMSFIALMAIPRSVGRNRRRHYAASMGLVYCRCASNAPYGLTLLLSDMDWRVTPLANRALRCEIKNRQIDAGGFVLCGDLAAEHCFCRVRICARGWAL